MRIAILATLALLAGCAPATMQGVRDLGPDKAYQFDVAQNYQQVYRTVLDQARKCHQAGMITAQMVVQGDLYHDTKSGTVSVALHGGLGVDTYQVIDMQAKGESVTSVKAHYSLGSVQKQGDLLKRWVIDKYPDCS